MMAEDLADLRRWVMCGAVVVFAHGAIAAAMVSWRDEIEPAEPAAAIVIEFAPVPVAPGIAEALLATAFGLAAAIPAVVIYNVFARSIAGYRAGLGDAAAEVLRLVSRDLERAVVPAPSARRASPLSAVERT